MSIEDKDDEVGYCKPPKKTRFKPGESGNRRGRPKGSMSLQERVEQLMERSISVIVDGKRTRMSRKEALVIKQIALALAGNRYSVDYLTRLLPGPNDNERTNLASPEEREQQRKIMSNFLARGQQTPEQATPAQPTRKARSNVIPMEDSDEV